MSIIQQFIKNANHHWLDYVEHEFVQQLAKGTLPKACFQHYLKQDYRFLFQYSRAISLGIFKANNFEDINFAQHMNQGLLSEIQLHIDYCRQWGISESSLFATEESPACVAYTRYVLDCGMKGGLAELYTALAPCAVGYAEIARRIQPISVENNPYQSWIDTYASAEFQADAQALCDYLDRLCQHLNESQRNELQQIFNTASRMETAFWQMGLDLS